MNLIVNLLGVSETNYLNFKSEFLINSKLFFMLDVIHGGQNKQNEGFPFMNGFKSFHRDALKPANEASDKNILLRKTSATRSFYEMTGNTRP